MAKVKVVLNRLRDDSVKLGVIERLEPVVGYGIRARPGVPNWGDAGSVWQALREYLRLPRRVGKRTAGQETRRQDHYQSERAAGRCRGRPGPPALPSHQRFSG